MGALHPVEWDSLRRKARQLAERVTPVYRVLNWCWNDSQRPPSRRRIEESALRLCADLRTLFEQNCDDPDFRGCSVNSGGLHAEASPNPEGFPSKWELRISFQCEQTHDCDEMEPTETREDDDA